jgi:iron complex outermembrane recepter protein
MRFYFIGAFLLCSLSATFSQQKSSNSTGKTNTNSDSIPNPKTKSYSLSEVSVSSLRAGDKSPIAYTNIDKETLSKSNFGQDIPYLLSTTPSLVTTSDAGAGVGYTGFRIRGTDASRINVTINGIPYNDADEQGAYWVDLPDFASSVQSIQVQRGVGSSTNGAGAFGANLSMQTDNAASKAGGEVGVTYGSFNTKKTTLKASTGLINNHWVIDTRLSSISSDGYIDRAATDLKSYFVQAGYYADNTSIKFVTFGGKEKTYQAWTGVESSFLPILLFARTYNPLGYMGVNKDSVPLYYKNQTDNYVQTHYQLLGNHVFSKDLSLNLGLHYTRGDGYYEEYNLDQTLHQYSLPNLLINGILETNSDLVTQKKMGNDFAGGVFSFNYKNSNFNAQLGGAANQYWGEQFGDVISVQKDSAKLIPITEYYRNKVNKKDVNIYLKASYDLSSTLNLSGDIQYRNVQYNLHGTHFAWDDAINGMQILNVDKTFNFFNPKAGLFYHPNLENDLYASFAIANREPTRTNFTASTLPTPETLYDYEAGYKFHNSLLSFGVNFYYMDYHDQLILTGKINSIGEGIAVNVAKSYRSGIELVGGVKPTDWLKWNGTATLSQNRVFDFVETVNVVDAYYVPTGESVNNVYNNTPIAYSPQITANSVFTFSVEKVELALQSFYVGSQFVDNTGHEDRKLPAYQFNNLRCSYLIPFEKLCSINLSLLVNNITNSMYISSAASYPSISQLTTPNPVYNANSKVNNDFYCSPQAGRNFLAMVTIKF